MLPQQVFDTIEAGKLPSKTLEELHSMLNDCNRFLAGAQFVPQTNYAVIRIRDELARRETERRQGELIAEQKHLKESVAGLGTSVEGVKGSIGALGASVEGVKVSLEKLAKPHWSVWATLIVAAIAAVASVIGYWPQIAAVFRALIP